MEFSILFKTHPPHSLREGLKKERKSDIYHFIWGGAAMVNYHFQFFFIPIVLRIISRHLSFFMYRGRGGPLGPWGAPQAPPLVLG